MSHRFAAVLHAVALVVALVANGLAVALPLNGQDTGELSDLYPNLFVPTGLTFSIWSLIYLGLLGFVAYGFTASAASALQRIGPWFAINALANAAWIVAWHWLQVGLSVGIMLVLLTSLIAMYLRLDIGGRSVPAAERWLVHAPISLYLGWITVATIANITALAVHLGAPSFGAWPAVATVGVIAVAAAITGLVLRNRGDVVFALVVSWAFLGIYLKRAGAPEDGSMWVAGAAAAAGAGVLAGAVLTAVPRKLAPLRAAS